MSEGTEKGARKAEAAAGGHVPTIQTARYYCAECKDTTGHMVNRSAAGTKEFLTTCLFCKTSQWR